MALTTDIVVNVKPLEWACEGQGCDAVIPQTPGVGRIKRFCSNPCRWRNRYYTYQGQRTTCKSADCDTITDPGTVRCPTHTSMMLLRQRMVKYGLTIDTAHQRMMRQGWVCAICTTPLDWEIAQIDHDHACCPTVQGKEGATCGRCTRGFLCRACNLRLGAIEHPLFEASIHYLKKRLLR